MPIRSAQQLGQMIAAARHAKNLSQRDVATQFGVAQSWLSQVERGKQMGRIGQVLRLAVGLGVEITARLPEPGETALPVFDYPNIDQIV